MNNTLFSKESDCWSTPSSLFAELDNEFHFELDAAALKETALCKEYYGPDHEEPSRTDALANSWAKSTWLNPPYSKCKEFIAKAAKESAKGCTVVCLIPSRTDTRYWHEHIWDAQKNNWRNGVSGRFIKGRLKFGNSKNSAPFPSVIIVFKKS